MKTFTKLISLAIIVCLVSMVTTQQAKAIKVEKAVSGIVIQATDPGITNNTTSFWINEKMAKDQSFSVANLPVIEVSYFATTTAIERADLVKYGIAKKTTIEGFMANSGQKNAKELVATPANALLVNSTSSMINSNCTVNMIAMMLAADFAKTTT